MLALFGMAKISVARAWSKIRDLFALRRGIVCITWFPRWSIPVPIIPCFDKARLILVFLCCHCISSNLVPYWSNYSICIYFFSLCQRSSILDACFLHRLGTKGSRQRTVIQWCIATVRSKFWIFKAIFFSHSLNIQRGSFFSFRMLTKATEVRW